MFSPSGDLRASLGRSDQGSLGTTHGGRGRCLGLCDTTNGQLVPEAERIKKKHLVKWSSTVPDILAACVK